jgi:hypothetical protein
LSSAGWAVSECRGYSTGEHIFELEPEADGRTRFTQRETFRGVLVPFMAKSLNTNIRQAFEDMNAALKVRAEDRAKERQPR